MTKYDAAWVAREEAKRAYMAEHGLWREEDEHSSCGVGLVVSIDGTRSRRVVEHGIDALKAVWHRGAVDADGKTGDGAGIHVQIPDAFFRDQIERTGHRQREGEKIAVGQVFLPRTDFGAQETGRTIVETEVLRMGHYIYGWRHVPVNVEVLGEKANATRPEIEQIIISNAKGVDEETFERELVRHPPADREGGGGGAGERALLRVAVLPVDHLQGDDAGRAGGRVLPRPEGRAVRERVCHLSPALFDQHLPAVVAGAAVPDACPQRRDQHAEGQRQLDEEPRDPHGLGHVRGDGRGHQADHPAGRVGFGGAGRRVRGAGARGAVCADGQDDAGAGVLVEAGAGAARGLARHVFLLQLGDGALGRARGARHDRRALGLRGARPERASGRCAMW
jgi:hypothetical protein